MKNRNLKSLVILVSIFLLSIMQYSCVDDIMNADKITKTSEYSPTIAAPIAHSKLTLRDIIRDYDKNELFEEDEKGFLYLMYQKQVYSEKAENYVILKDQSFPFDVLYTGNIYDDITPADGYRTFDKAEIYNDYLVNNEQQLTKIVYDTLDLKIDVSSTYQLDGVLIISFPELKNENGTAFSSTLNLDATGSYTKTLNYQLKNYTLSLKDGSDHNKAFLQLDLKIKDGSANDDDNVKVTISFNNQNFDAIYGYIGQYKIDIPQDTVHLDIFDKAFKGSMYFEDPSFILKIHNSLGVPIRMYFGDTLETFSIVDGGKNYNYPFPGDDSLNINYPTTIGGIAYQEVIYDATTFPEMQDMIAHNPKFMSFSVSGKTNPDANLGISNVITDLDKFDVDLQLKLPLWGYGDYSLVDTIGLDIESNYDKLSKNFREANLRLIFDNFLPLDTYMQVLLTDDNYKVIDTVFTTSATLGDRLIKSAVLDKNGRAKQSTQKINDILFGNGPEYEHDINTLDRVKHAIIISTLITTDKANKKLVKLFSDNYLEIRVGVKGQGQLR